MACCRSSLNGISTAKVHKEARVYTFMRLFKVASTRRTSFLITSHQIGKFCFFLLTIFQSNLIYTREVITNMFIFLRSFSHISRNSHVSSHVRIFSRGTREASVSDEHRVVKMVNSVVRPDGVGVRGKG